ncbi:DUF2178 domain-containing protein [Natronomonas sp. EA1]|uniref:DUF2178 domain-containing protein n=1 Tax=Natronomonas sp. EA1 TaxID=3421655 RepID=UPI003EBADE99
MTTTNPVQSGRRYRRLFFGIITIGVVAFLAAMLVGQFLAGLVVYTVAVVAGFALFFYVRFSDSLAMGDERENELERRASHLTFELFGYGGLFTFITLFFLDATGRYTLDGPAETLLYAFAVVSLGWGLVYAVLRVRR